MQRRDQADRVHLGFIFVSLAVVFSVLAGCAARNYDELPSAGIDLSGEWKLDPSRSDDVKKLLQSRRVQDDHRLNRRPPRGPMAGTVPGAEGPQGSQESQGPQGPQRAPFQFRARGIGERFADQLEAPTQMTIVQKANRLLVRHDATSDEYRAGDQTVVSFGKGGVADRRAGWKGRIFFVTTQSVDGPRKEDRYSLEPDGTLKLFTELTGDRDPKIEITRIYQRVKAQ